jgi:dolichol-phosphate mannosyltransferase
LGAKVGFGNGANALKVRMDGTAETWKAWGRSLDLKDAASRAQIWGDWLLLIRIGLNFAIAPSYDFSQAKASWLFWLSPLADPLAVLRIFLSSIQTPKSWRGRTYEG